MTLIIITPTGIPLKSRKRDVEALIIEDEIRVYGKRLCNARGVEHK
jgi:hypothetical protein